MGEITEALKRARLEQESRRSAEPARTSTRIADRIQRAEPRIPSTRPTTEEPAQPTPARIDRLRTPCWQARAMLVEGQRAIAERFRQLAVSVEQELAARNARTLLVTSSHRQEGKTLTACNLALAMASLEADRQVALVDLDLRRPSVAKSLGIPVAHGIEHVLRGEIPSADARIATDIPALDVYAPSSPVHNAHALLSSVAFEELLRDLRERYSTVVIDTPPVLLVPDVPLIAGHVGATLFVARAGASRRNAMLDALRLLPREVLIGIFLNDARGGSRALRYYEEYYGPDEDDEALDEGGRA